MEWLTALIGTAGLVTGALLTWAATRRASSGRIGTSEAAVLWDQAQAMRLELVTRLDKVTEQRDRLIESQAQAILPALAGINDSLREITGSLARLEHSGDGGGALARNQAPPPAAAGGS